MTDDGDIAQLRTIADYQFGRGAGRGLFPPDESREYKRTTSGRVAQVIADDGRLVSLGIDGRFTLGLAGGKRLLDAFDPPACRVGVGEESEPFVREGRNAFAKFVTRVDDRIRPGDEVVVVDGDDAPLGVGRAELSAAAMADFDTGMAVTIREGADS
jgi:uncharacterized protein with predicted RNA binding PUA domain